METQRRSHDKGENLVYILSTLRERGWFPEIDTALKAKLAEALFVVGRDKLHFDLAHEARNHFWRCFRLSHRLRPLAGTAVTFLPRSFRAGLRTWLRLLRKMAERRHGRDGQNPLGSVRSVR